MWQFRRRRKDLTAKDEAELQELFNAIPELELPYCFREDIAEVFDTASSREEAERRLAELRNRSRPFGPRNLPVIGGRGTSAVRCGGNSRERRLRMCSAPAREWRRRESRLRRF